MYAIFARKMKERKDRNVQKKWQKEEIAEKAEEVEITGSDKKR